MVFDERLSAFVELIYESPHDTSAWDRMAKGLLALTHSRALLCSAVDAQHESFGWLRMYGAEDSRMARAMDEYSAGVCHIDPTLRFAAQHPTAGFCDSERSLPGDDYLKHPMIRWNCHHFGATHWIVGYTPPRDGLTIGVSLHTPADVGHMTKSDERVFRMLFPHVVRAVTMAARPPDLADGRNALILVNILGHVLRANESALALALEGDAFTLEGDMIMPTHIGVRASFARMLDAALKRDVVDPHSSGIKLPRRSGRPDLLAVVDPIAHSSSIAGVMGAAAIVRFVDSLARASDMHVQQQMFGFTDREAEVANLLVQGHSVESAGHVMQISSATVRLHLRALFRKTGTARQSDLINLLLRIN